MRAPHGVTLGMPTLLALPDVLDCAALCASLGLAFVELNMNLPAYQPGIFDERAIARARERYGVFCTLHLDENLSVCDFNPLVRQAHVQTVLEAIALARRHGMPVINFHLNSGVYFTLPRGRAYLFEAYRRDYLAALRAFGDLCARAVGNSGVRLCVENCGGFPPFLREGIELLLQSDVFGLTWDTGHNACANMADAPFFRAHADRLAHMHLHDAKGGACHLPLGEGTLDIAGALRLARTRGCRVVIEVKEEEGLRRSVEGLRGYV